MMWDHVMERIAAEILRDPTINTIIGTNFRAAATGEQIIPLIEWTLIGDTETELWSPMIFQFDIWTESMTHMRTLERRLRQLYHNDVLRTLRGLRMFMQYQDSTWLDTPDRSNSYGRSVRFQFTPLREKYTLSTV